MATYTIKYGDGTTDRVEAESVAYDYDESIFYLRGHDDRVVAWIPSINVLSICGQPYPRKDGDLTVLGPDTLASSDETVIRWKGQYYVRRPTPEGTAR
jgi:hypothetical protein